VKNPLLLFTIKCSVILYFAACTGIGDYAADITATPYVTKGTWKLNLYNTVNKSQVDDLTAYTFKFDPGGKIIASKDGMKITGNWSEDEILKRITISLDTKDPALKKLNDYWSISTITKTGVSLKNSKDPLKGGLQITSL